MKRLKLFFLATALAAFFLSRAALAETAEHGAEHKTGLPQFDPSSFPGQVLWLAVTFAVLYVFFSKKTLPDIAAILKRRSLHIGSTLESAKRQKEVADQLKKEYESGIDNARHEATKAFTDVEKEIKEKTGRENKAFLDRAAEKTGHAENDIRKAKAEAMEDMHALAAEIASMAAEKIIGIETDIGEAKNVVRSLHGARAKAA